MIKTQIKPGDIFGSLIIIKLYSQNKTKHNLWQCRCACGNYTIVSSSNIKRTKSCGCSKHKKSADNPVWKGYKDVSGTYISALKYGAKIRDIYYDPNITAKYLYELFLKQNKQCAITGEKIDLTNDASVDRIDSTKDYIIGNLWWVKKDINKMKLDFPLNLFIELCEKVVANKENIRNGR